MSTVRFIGLRCDGCKGAMRNDTTGDAIFLESARSLRHVATSRGWRCRAWTRNLGQIDACPACIPKMKWGSPLAKEKPGRR